MYNKNIPIKEISIHALVKRATILAFVILLDAFDFNPRPREEGDTIRNTHVIVIAISIHALVKRATVYGISVQNKYGISIHALVKRATSCII